MMTCKLKSGTEKSKHYQGSLQVHKVKALAVKYALSMCLYYYGTLILDLFLFVFGLILLLCAAV